ncbi:MAG TPA: VWA domain-containing protein [Vicinamibacterales bacterium]|nr:VWA domain-containing protein [Vicinamibacterales bacterium]
MNAPPGDALLARLLGFGRALRRLGLDVHTGRMLDVVEALSCIDIARRDDVFHVCRALLVHRHEDLEAFDRAFDAFWSPAAEAEPRSASEPGDAPGKKPASQGPEPMGLLETQTDAAGAAGEEDSLDVPAWSDLEALATKDFAEFSESELAAARDAIERLEWQPGVRRTRRWVSGRGSRLDLRRALARSVRTGGDMVRLPRRVRRLRPRPIVLLCDVSGSMEVYARLLVHFAYALTRRHRRVEAFLFSTRLTRITRELRASRIDDAVRAVSKAVPDWSGGTRIGASLQEFHRRWGRRALARGPVALLVSDGWDRGEPAVLAAAVSRLQRSCHRLIWLNPLIGTQDYQPLTRGLVAALPHVDEFLPARSLRDIAQLARILGGVGREGREGRVGRVGGEGRVG